MFKYLFTIGLLCGTLFGQTYFIKSGAANPSVDVLMTKVADGTTAPNTLTIANIWISYTPSGSMVSSTRTGSLQTNSADIDALATEETAWNDLSMIARPYGGFYRLDLPAAAVVGAVGTMVNVYVTDGTNVGTVGTYEGHVIIMLSPPVDVITVNGATPNNAANVATAVWQDTTAGDFTTTSSIGKSLYTTGAVPGAAGGLFIAGTNAQTTVTSGFGTNSITATSIAADAIGASELAADAATEVAAATWNSLTASYVGAGTFGLLLGIPIPPGSDFGPNASKAVLELVGNVGGASLSTTTTIYLTANTLDASLYVAGTTILFADASGVYHFGTILSNTSDVLSLTQASTGTPADQTPIYSLGKMIANEVWNADNTTYNTEHTYGEDLGGINLSLITAAANAIWDEDLGDHIVKNSFGSVVQDDLAGLVTSVALIPQSGSTVSWNSTALGAIADAVWDELINAGHSTANSAGKIVYDNINASLTTLTTNVNTIDDLLDTEIGTLTTEMAKVPKSDSTVSWNSTALGAIATTMMAKALTVPTAGASPDTPTLDEALSWLYSRWFNKSITTTSEYQLFKRNETDKVYEQDISDDGTSLTVGEAKAAD